VEELGTLETSERIKGRDGGYSGAWRGRSIWLYGDTILALEGEDGSSWRHNSWSFTEDLDPADGISGFVERTDAKGAPRELFPPTQEEAEFNGGDARMIPWPGAIVADVERDRALIFYFEIYGEPGEWNFHGIGHGIAVWEDFASQPARPEQTLFQADEPTFGTAALALEDHLYAYGCDGGFTKSCKLGRVPLATPLDRSTWEFFDGDAWTAELGEAAVVLDGGAMMSVHFSDHLGAYLAVYSKPLDDRVAARIAPAPEGPWSEEVLLFEAESSHDGDASYGALAHAEYAHEGTELITYFRSPGEWRGEIRTVRVRLEPSDFW
jgi:hypothetical protein